MSYRTGFHFWPRCYLNTCCNRDFALFNLTQNPAWPDGQGNKKVKPREAPRDAFGKNFIPRCYFNFWVSGFRFAQLPPTTQRWPARLDELVGQGPNFHLISSIILMEFDGIRQSLISACALIPIASGFWESGNCNTIVFLLVRILLTVTDHW